MFRSSNAYIKNQDWFDRGKTDAWAGKSKQVPENDPQAASLYDLGYCEGEIERSPVNPRKQNSEQQHS